MQNLDYLPFGELNSTDSGYTTHKFTGDERDSETNLDHTWFRQYSSQFGRWMHPDPAGLAAVDPSNPQSWNRYAYVLNNPLALIDPLGLDWQCFDVTVGGQTRTQCKWVPDPGDNGGANPNCAPVTLDGGSLGSTCDTPCNEFMLNPRPCSRTDEENIRGNSSWWGAFARDFFGNFSFKGAKQPGETWSACVDRSQDALLGQTGTAVLNSLVPLGALGTAYTTPVTAATDMPGVSVIRSAWEADLAANARAGTGLANFATKASGPLSKALGIVTAVAAGVKGGFYVACAH